MLLSFLLQDQNKRASTALDACILFYLCSFSLTVFSTRKQGRLEMQSLGSPNCNPIYYRRYCGSGNPRKAYCRWEISKKRTERERESNKASGWQVSCHCSRKVVCSCGDFLIWDLSLSLFPKHNLFLFLSLPLCFLVLLPNRDELEDL